MAIEDVFNGAKAAMILNYGYINTVAQEIGMERALALYTKMCENMAAMQAKMMKEQAGIKEFDAKAAWSLLKTTPDSVGCSIEVVEESPRRVRVKIGKCAVYEAAQTMGLDLKAFCLAGPNRFMDTGAKQLNPKLSFQMRKFRSAPDDFCEEEVVLEK
ncbi:MAG: L-2-amino-thiazoline-4-carboxylic acid hydrolase [Methanophagales archaeon]|nr:L-2-amino-thiazoline-4-carboxylic acid hydrolase [Methanophagales archaeon]